MTEYIYPSKYYNFLTNNKLIDIFKKFNLENDVSFTKNFILSKGKCFENYLIKFLIKDYSNKTLLKDMNERTYENSIKLIRDKNYQILYDLPLKDDRLQFKGVIDILIRSDVINKICPEYKVKDNSKYYYILGEIKYTNLVLSNKNEIRDCKNQYYYQIQSYIYWRILKSIDNTIGNNVSVIIGNTNDSKNYKSGLIKYTINNIEKFNKTIKEMRKWNKFLNNYHQGNINTNINNISNINNKKYIYPNMKSKNKDYLKFKKEIAIKNGEITQLIYCDIKHRNNAISKNINSIFNQKLNAEILGYSNESYYGKIINNILKSQINKKQYNICNVNLSNLENINNYAFVDTEFFSPIVYDKFNNKHNYIKLYLIGIYFFNNNNKEDEKWEYKYFLAKKHIKPADDEIKNNFKIFLNKLNINTLIYWDAEKYILSYLENNIKLINLKNILIENKISFKNCFNYKLKNIYKAIEKLINKNNNIQNILNYTELGLDGLEVSIKMFQKYKNNLTKIDKEIQSFIKYNFYDCKSMFIILKWLLTQYNKIKSKN